MSESKKLELSPSVSIIIAGIIIAGAIVFTSGKQPSAPALTGTNPAPAVTPHLRPVTAADHIVGSPSAPVILVEYSDFQCPYCSMIYPTLKKIVGESNGQIAWVYRQMPLTSIHPQAQPAAEASECISEQLGNVGFWKYADAVFADQSKLTPEYSAGLAKEFGADPAKYTACISSGKYKDKITADTAEAQSNGGNGTPFTVVLNTKNGKAAPVSGALPFEQIAAVVKSVQ